MKDGQSREFIRVTNLRESNDRFVIRVHMAVRHSLLGE